MAKSRFDPRVASPTMGIPVPNELHLPGWDGMPYYGTPGMFKAKDPEKMQPRQGMRTHVDIYNLSVPDEKKQYEEVIQIIANGYGMLSKEDLQYDRAEKIWRVYIRWAEVFAYNPQETGKDGTLRETGGIGGERVAGEAQEPGGAAPQDHPIFP